MHGIASEDEPFSLQVKQDFIKKEGCNPEHSEYTRYPPNHQNEYLQISLKIGGKKVVLLRKPLEK